MEIFSLRILTIVNILYVLRILLFLLVFTILISLTFGSKHHNALYFLGWMFILASVSFGVQFFNHVKKIIISKAKYPLPLNLICNILKIGKPYYFGKDTFNLDEIVSDNKLTLTFYYINNHQHPILQFNKDKLIFHNQEYDWKNLNWKYFLYSKTPHWNGRRDGKYVIEFTGSNQDNIRIKNKIEFEKIKADENEVILLFVIHDLLFGTKSSYYY
ncbi:hypothetical protein [Chryseobacterium hispalense]|uniref:hypothetical protein n=1 Tax=Chryseobacterium hispalense TaxID=1453492 RepID=UPI0004936901|nr:hypothetical protein [Chryseobacterium hispalense]